MKSMSLLVVMCVVACGSAQRETETLTDSIRSYNEGIRWQRFAVAANQLPVSERSAFVAEMDERAEDIRITDYEVINVDKRGRSEARVQVKVSWYRDSEGSLHETHAVQTWERHGKAWWMVDETRLRGPELPGLTNPAIDPVDDPATDPATDRATDPATGPGASPVAAGGTSAKSASVGVNAAPASP